MNKGLGRLLVLAAFAAGLALTGCGPTGGSTESAGSGEAASYTKADETHEVEVASFQGGYGIDFFQEAGKEWASETGRKVKVWGDPRVWEKLRPRFVAGDVPDLAWPGWGMDYWALVYDDQLAAWDAALDSPAYGKTEGKWRDSFDAGLLKMGQNEGKTYMLPYHVNINGWWYNKTLFEKNGWTPPATWDELIALNDKIKAKGIAPLTFQGQYPFYMLSGFIYPLIISHGGIEAWNACQNLEEGAWTSESVINAATKAQELVKRGDFLQGSIGLNHTDSQAAFYEGKAAMIPCGSWLHAEMENYRKDMKGPVPVAEFMRVPNLTGGKGDPTAIQVGIEPFVIPSGAKDNSAGIEIYKYMTSPEKAKQFVEQKGTLMAVKAADGVKYPSHLVKAAEIFDGAQTKWHSDFRQWYPTLGKEAENAMAALLGGDITPQQFGERIEKEAAKVRNDKNITKRKVD